MLEQTNGSWKLASRSQRQLPSCLFIYEHSLLVGTSYTCEKEKYNLTISYVSTDGPCHTSSIDLVHNIPSKILTIVFSHYYTDEFQAVISGGIIAPLLHLLQTAEFDIKKEAAWAISNATSGGSHEQIKYVHSTCCIAIQLPCNASYLFIFQASLRTYCMPCVGIWCLRAASSHCATFLFALIQEL